MLDIVRNLVSSIFGKILLAIMILSFALWGVGDILSSGNSKLAAKVGAQKISLEEFYNKLGKKVQELNISTGGQMTIKEAHEQNISRFVINDLVYERMVLEFAEKNQIYLNDDILKDAIKKLPQFINADGKFSEKLYRNSIKRNFSSEAEFINELTFVYINSILFENFKSGSMTNQEIVDLLYEYEGEERNIDYFIFNKNDILVDISQDEITEYYKNNQSKYLTDEIRTIEYLELNINDYRKLVSASNNDSLNYYNQNKDLYFEKEKRSVELARFKNKQEAEKFYGIWKKNNTKELEKYTANNDISISKIDDLTKDGFDENVTNEIFKLENNSISSPIKISDAGYYVAKVTNISPENQKSYNDVKHDILDEISYNEAYELFDQALNYADDLLLSGYDLTDIAENLDLKSIKEKSNDIIIKSELNNFIDTQKNRELFSAAYENKKNYISEIIIDNESAFIFKIIDIKEPYIQDLSDINDQVKKDVKNTKIIDILDENAKRFLIENQFKSYDQFNKYIESNGFKLISLESIKRNSNKTNFDNLTIQEIFSSNKDNIIKFKDLDDNVGVLYVKDIISPKDKISNEYYNQVSNNIYQNYDISIENILGDSIIEESTYEIFIQNIDNLF